MRVFIAISIIIISIITCSRVSAAAESAQLSYIHTVEACQAYMLNFLNRTQTRFENLDSIMRVWVVGDIVCVSASNIDNELATAFEKAILESVIPIRRMVVSSLGGSVTAAIRMAKIIRDRKLAIYPWGLCLSSCANYLFMSAEVKYYGTYVGVGPIVGFHGAPKFHNNEDKDLAEKLAAITALHDEFFIYIGVSDYFTYNLPCNLVGDRVFNETQEKLGRTNIYWVLPPQELEKGYGIKGLRYDSDFKYVVKDRSWKLSDLEGFPLPGGFLGISSCK